METLKEKFEALTHRIQSSGKPAAAWFPQFTPVTMMNATCCVRICLGHP